MLEVGYEMESASERPTTVELIWMFKLKICCCQIGK